MAPTLLSFTVTLLLHSLASTVTAASVPNHGRLHNLRHRSLVARDPDPVAGWESKGCYTDDGGSRTLYDLMYTNDTLTTESCISYCSTRNYPYAGTEYAKECFCGRAIAASGTVAPAADCSFNCGGNANQKCGGSSRINIYHNKTDVASAKPPATNAGPAGWGFLGCYVDSQGTRTLPYGAATLGGGNNMTVANCATECKKQGYTYAGVEYAGECFCGNALSDSKLAPDGLTGCNRLCNGNTTEYCGGANRLNVYGYGMRSTIAPLWNPVGCYNDSVAARTLRYGVEVQGGYTNMTIPGCTTACQAKGYILAGLSYSQECFCDNAYQSYGAPAADGCNMACKGDPSTICGGSNRLNVYAYDTGATSSKTTTTAAAATSTTAAASSTTTTTTATPTSTVAPIGNWTYGGCYVDNAYGRILSLFTPSPADTTINSCVDYCRTNGYTVAGVEYSTQCFCGNALINGAKLATADSQCNMQCGGNSSQICGAGDRMSIYSSSKNITIYPVATAQNTSLPANWTYQGCLAEKQGGRVFEHFIDWPTNNSVSSCLSKCAEFGFTAGGLQYGEQCFCGDDYDRTNAKVAYLTESACAMSCPGDPYHVCGGPAAFSYYTSTVGPKWNQGSGNSAGSYDFLIGGVVIPLITQIGINGKVVLTEKHGTGPPNSTGAYELDVSQISKGMTASWREMYGLKTDVFCSAGLTLPDKAGRILNIGGWSGDSTFGVRLYWPDGSDGVVGKHDWEEDYNSLSLQAGRWYPSALQLVNGSILVIGGQEGSNGPPVPSIEILPKPAGGYVKELEWLRNTDPYNLYPFITVLPTGDLCVFYYNEARVLSSVDFSTIRSLPNIPGSVENFKAGRTYPLEGTAMLLPQKAPYTDPLRVIICGGSTPFTGLALDNCVSIAPQDPSSKWVIERMPDKRVLTCMTALPDGTYLILNGVRQGEGGFGLGQDPGHMAMLYDPEKPYNNRFTRMANTTIDRMYHSEAILLLDGRVLVTGSDPEDGVHVQEYRVETFTPPYLMGTRASTRPKYNITNKDWAYGQSVTITITSSASAISKISLLAAVASTHGNSMGQRTILPAFSCSGSTCTIQAPPNGNIAGGPGWHMLFVLDAQGTPSVGQWVRIGGDPAGLGNWPNAAAFSLPGV